VVLDFTNPLHASTDQQLLIGLMLYALQCAA